MAEKRNLQEVVKEIYAKIDETFKIALLISVGLLCLSFYYPGWVGIFLVAAGAMVFPAWLVLRQAMFWVMFERALEKYELTD
jgi:hypothetical protein